MDKLPAKIKNCPIIEAIIEVRFSSIFPPEAVFGIIYERINKYFGNIERLPVLQIPEHIRTQDKNLSNQPHYILIAKDNPNIQLKLGPKVLTFINTDEYAGWRIYFAFVQKILEEIKNINVISSAERIGIRYINFFNEPIFDKIKFQVTLNDHQVLEKETSFRTETKTGDFDKITQIANMIPIIRNNQEYIGSLIDFDCMYDFKDVTNEQSFYNSYQSIIEKGHEIQKKSFFELLTNKFLKSLCPTFKEE